MRQLFKQAYDGQTVLVTGHTGFKGAWLSEWLLQMGANVVGFSLPESVSEPNLFSLLNLANKVTDVRGSITNASALANVVRDHRPTTILVKQCEH